jgi:hypothetical protein
LRIGHEGRPALLSVDDKTNPVLVGMKAVQHGQIALARNAKGMGHALFNQALDQ